MILRHPMFVLFSLICWLMLLQACTPRLRTRDQVPGVQASYHLKPGDIVLLTFQHYPKMKQSVVVSPEGVIQLKGIGKVNISGRTRAQVTKLLQRRYMEFLPNPEMRVAVVPAARFSVYFGGELRKPGKIRYEPGLSLLEGISRAGGFVEKKKNYQIVVFRNRGKLGVKTFEFNRMNDREYLKGKFKLDPYDVVLITTKSRVRNRLNRLGTEI